MRRRTEAIAMASITIAKILGDNEPLTLDVQEQLISEPLAVLGVRHIGKSYQAGWICEELCRVGQPFIVIDPEGEYWTLKGEVPRHRRLHRHAREQARGVQSRPSSHPRDCSKPRWQDYRDGVQRSPRPPEVTEG